VFVGIGLKSLPVARGKHSSILRKFVNYGQKGFITLGHGLNVIKGFTGIICEFS
jgi:hypothetical protein